MGRKFYRNESRTTIDADGVITETQISTQVSGNNEPTYIKMYCEDIGFYGGLSPMEAKVLFALAMMADFDNEVRASKYDREKIAELLNKGLEEGKGTTAESVRFCIGGLVKARFLAKKATGLYILNPDYFSRKSWAKTRETKSTFEMHIRYSPENGRQTKIIHQNIQE